MKLAAVVLALALLVAVFAKDKTPEPVETEKVVLDPFRVKGQATSNFAIDIQIVKDGTTNKVIRIEVTRVMPNTDASEAGLAAGDEIISMDGVPVRGMDAKIDFASQIGRILLNRQMGEELRLEVMMRRPKKVVLRANMNRGDWSKSAP